MEDVSYCWLTGVEVAIFHLDNLSRAVSFLQNTVWAGIWNVIKRIAAKPAKSYGPSPTPSFSCRSNDTTKRFQNTRRYFICVSERIWSTDSITFHLPRWGTGPQAVRKVDMVNDKTGACSGIWGHWSGTQLQETRDISRWETPDQVGHKASGEQAGRTY